MEGREEGGREERKGRDRERELQRIMKEYKQQQTYTSLISCLIDLTII